MNNQLNIYSNPKSHISSYIYSGMCYKRQKQVVSLSNSYKYLLYFQNKDKNEYLGNICWTRTDKRGQYIDNL